MRALIHTESLNHSFSQMLTTHVFVHVPQLEQLRESLGGDLSVEAVEG